MPRTTNSTLEMFAFALHGTLFRKAVMKIMLNSIIDFTFHRQTISSYSVCLFSLIFMESIVHEYFPNIAVQELFRYVTMIRLHLFKVLKRHI